MFEDMAPKLARIMTEYSVPVQKGDFAVIMAGSETEPLAMAMHEAVMRRGGHPFVWTWFPDVGEQFFVLAEEHQLQFANPVVKKLVETVDVYYSIRANNNNKALAQVDPQKLQLNQQSGKEINDIYRERVATGEIRWCIMPWPTQADAQQADMGHVAWKKFIYEACALHLDDPIEYWVNMGKRQSRLVDYLNEKSEMHVKGPGIDLQLCIKGRKWINSHGAKNFPDGEIFTGPVEDSVNGYVEFNFPTVYLSREVSGVRLEYRDGVVVDATAAKGEDFLLSQLDLDEDARKMGEFAIGTNDFIQEFTGSTLYDEKIGGTIHMALGLSLPGTGGTNVSQVHWDMVHNMKDGGEIYVDGELFYRAGEFMV
ncbi:MAG: aminopeptidase [Chloroflexi bacterium]|nr:aminopeptidase [Chloroflexota bacterium]